ncbi:MAG: LPS-assembly protein LptD [Bacteroidales bacterium]|nr:LPS-assembly protein LptD [Bacteroidales bacterium]
MPQDSVTQQQETKSEKKDSGLDSPVTYSSQDSIVFQISGNSVQTYGDGKVKYENIDLESEYIELNVVKREVFAKGLPDSTNEVKGSPVYKDASESFDADSMRYNFDSKKGLAFGIYTQQDEAYLHGGRTKIHDNKEIHIQHGKYTTCDDKDPHFFVEMTKAKIVIDDKIVFGPAWVVVDEIPIPVVLPFGYFPIKKGRSNGIIIPTIGEESTKGFYFRNGGVYFGISEYVDFKWLADVYSLGSWRTTLSSNYKVRYRFNGNFSVTYASLVSNEIRQAPTFNVKWSHSQTQKSPYSPNFSANVNYGSAGYAKQNTYSTSEYLNNQISSNIYLSKKFAGTPLAISASLSHSQNNIDSTITLTLPQLRLTASTFTPLKRKHAVGKERFYEKIAVSYTGEMQNKLVNAKLDSNFYRKETLDLFQSGINHSIPVSASFKLFKYITVSPSFNYQERWYTTKLKKEWDDNYIQYTKTDTIIGGVRIDTLSEFSRVYNYSVGVSANTKIYGMYRFRGQALKAIRHVVTPSVSYTITPDFSSDKYGYYGKYVKNSSGDEALYSYYEKGIYGVPSSQKQSSISFSLGNNVEAKVRSKTDTVTGTKKIKLIENLSLNGSYNFAADSLKMSLISLSGYSTILNRFTVRYSATFDPYAIGVKESDNGSRTQVRVNNYMIDKYGSLWRKTQDQWATSLSYTFGPINDKDDNLNLPVDEMYSYWDVPWNLSVSYSLSIPRKYYYDYNNQLDSVSNNVIQTISASGKVSLTKNWNIAFSTGWDFEEKGISYTTLNVYRDLHCWDMAFTWVPFGDRQRWEFTLKIKASMLSDIKIDMKSSSDYF